MVQLHDGGQSRRMSASTWIPKRLRLSTLLIGVTVFCCWLGWEVNVVRMRQNVLRQARQRYSEIWKAADYQATFSKSPPPNPIAKIPIWRRWLGDEAIQEIGVMRSVMNDSERANLRFWFPEAKIVSVVPQEPCHPGCFPAGTPVLAATGWREIETIRVGEKLIVIDEDGNRYPVGVTSVFTTRNELLRVETESGSLLTTPQQPLATSLSEHVAAGKLRAGDTVMRWSDDRIVGVQVKRVVQTGRVVNVFNLVLQRSERFVADRFLVRSKPPVVPGESVVTESIVPHDAVLRVGEEGMAANRPR